MAQKSISSSARILTVDDEKFIREFITDGLTRAGYHCFAAQSAREASAVLGETMIDLVLLAATCRGVSSHGSSVANRRRTSLPVRSGVSAQQTIVAGTAAA